MIASAAAVFFLFALAATAVFYLQTKDGVIRIEIDDPTVEVVLTKTGAVVKGAGPHEIKIEPGEQGLKIKRGDLEFETDNFVLRKGETVTLKVELLKGKLQVAQGDRVIGERDLPVAEKKEKLPQPKPSEPDPSDPLRSLARESISKKEPVESLPDEVVAVFGSHVWRHWSGQVLLTFAENGQDAIALDRYGTQRWSALDSNGDTSKSWDVATGKQRHSFTLPKSYASTYLPEARAVVHMAVRGNEWIYQLWKIDTGKKIVQLVSAATGLSYPPAIAAAPGGELIAIAVRELDLWDPRTGKHVARLSGQLPPDLPSRALPGSAAFSADGKLLAVVYWSEGTGEKSFTLFKVFDVAARKEIHSELERKSLLPAGQAHAVFTPDAAGIVVGVMESNKARGGWDSYVRVWDLSTKAWRDLKLPYSGSFALSPDGKSIVLVDGLYDATMGKKLVSFDGPGIHTALAFSQDGKRIVGIAGNHSDEIVMYDAATGKRLSPAPEPAFNFLEVSADGTMMAVPHENVLRLVDTVARKDRVALSLALGKRFDFAAFSPDGTRLVARSLNDGALRLRNCQRRQPGVDHSRHIPAQVRVRDLGGR